jgi:hypothetical protein
MALTASMIVCTRSRASALDRLTTRPLYHTDTQLHAMAMYQLGTIVRLEKRQVRGRFQEPLVTFVDPWRRSLIARCMNTLHGPTTAG